MSAQRLSRRGLFGEGIRRVVEERLRALDDLPPTPPEAPPAVDVEAARQAWGEGDPRPLFARLEPAADRLVAAAGIRRGQRVLDVGAGDGNLALALARVGAIAVACDPSPPLVERGRARTRAAGFEADWAVAGAEALPYEDESFDCVLSNFGVIHAHDPRRAVAELERVVRPGGTVALTAWSPGGAMAGALRLAAEPDPSTPGAPRAERWGRYETATLRFGGFDDFDMLDRTLRMTFAGEDDMWSVFASPPGPLASRIRAGADVVWLRERFLRMVAPDRRDDAAGPGLDVPYAIVLGRRRDRDGPSSR